MPGKSRLIVGARSIPIAAALLGALLTGCATGPDVGDLPDRPWAGHLITRDDGSWFRPCQAEPGAPLLWVTFTDASVRQIESARSDGVGVVGDTAFVRWRAALTDERLVGPGGPALLVRDIAAVRPAREDDCVAGPPRS